MKSMNVMDEKVFSFAARDGANILVYQWRSQASPLAVVQIIHGLAEHAVRYRRMAEQLTAAGYAVYASDLRGHGNLCAARKSWGSSPSMMAGANAWMISGSSINSLPTKIQMCLFYCLATPWALHWHAR